MANTYFSMKQFTVHQDQCAMKVTTDACLFGAWCAQEIVVKNEGPVLDIGAGTGLLSLMISQQTNLRIDAVEIDASAAAQAKANVAGSIFKDQVHIINEDFSLYTPGCQYPVILSNPPFYENELKSQQALKNIAHHGDGLLLSDLAAKAFSLLLPGGHFYLMYPYKRTAELEKEMMHQGFHIHQKILVSQTYSHTPFRVFYRLGNAYEPYTETSIFIKDDSNRYTPEFTHLLKDYYLHL